MSQHDYNIANQGFPNFRSDLNNALGAIATNNSGSTAPTTTFAHQWWLDTSTTPNTLRIRNADNDAWVVIGTVDQSTDKFKLTPADGISTDTISELTSAAGVTIDSVLLKDGGVTVSDGTVSAPTVTNTGDTNTGIYFPAADEVAVAAGGSVAAAFNSHQFMGMRNRIINGDMRIDQRNAGAAVTVNGNSPFITDRFRCDDATDGAYTAQQVTTAPAGFTNSVQVTVTTSDASLAAGQYALFYHAIEGNNVADLGWGTANAKTVTLSFWVRSSLTGTFSGSLENNANNRSYIFTYSISVSDTWEYKTITIPGDTSGTWETGTAIGIRANWSLGVGSDFLGTAGSWGNRFFGATGSASVIGTLNATWYITGVQLEVGSTATPFERRPYGTELALCQRYYEKSMPIGTAPTGTNTAGLPVVTAFSTSLAGGWVPHKVTMRAAPTLTIYRSNGTSGAAEVFTSGAVVTGTITAPEPSESGFRYINNGSSGFTSGVGYQFGYTASAEL